MYNLLDGSCFPISVVDFRTIQNHISQFAELAALKHLIVVNTLLKNVYRNFTEFIRFY